VSYSGSVSRVSPWFLTFILHTDEIRVSTEEKGEKREIGKNLSDFLFIRITQ
jgi:hypothetical protein